MYAVYIRVPYTNQHFRIQISHPQPSPPMGRSFQLHQSLRHAAQASLGLFRLDTEFLHGASPNVPWKSFIQAKRSQEKEMITL